MKKISSKIKRKIRNRKKLKNVNSNKLRITVFKSSKNISAQIIDNKTKLPYFQYYKEPMWIREKKVPTGYV